MNKKPTSKNTKNQLLEISEQLYLENHQLTVQVQKLETENRSLKSKVATTAAPKQDTKSLVKTEEVPAIPQTVPGIIEHLETIRTQFGQANSELSTSLFAYANELAELNKSISVEKDDLFKLYEVDTTKTTLANLIEDYDQKAQERDTEFRDSKEEREKELSSQKQELQDAKSSHAALVKEKTEKSIKAQKRESDEYVYNLDLKRKVNQQTYDLDYNKKQLELDSRREKQFSKLETKEKEISSSEADFAKVKAKAEAIEEECKQAIEKARTEALETAKKEAQIKADLRAKEIDGEKRLFESNISALESKVKNQEKQIQALQVQIDSASQKAQSIAIKSIEGASNAISFEAVKEIALEQAQHVAK